MNFAQVLLFTVLIFFWGSVSIPIVVHFRLPPVMIWVFALPMTFGVLVLIELRRLMKQKRQRMDRTKDGATEGDAEREQKK